jgi:hypothetical protein
MTRGDFISLLVIIAIGLAIVFIPDNRKSMTELNVFCDPYQAVQQLPDNKVVCKSEKGLVIKDIIK